MLPFARRMPDVEDRYFFGLLIHVIVNDIWKSSSTQPSDALLTLLSSAPRKLFQ
jgi:hypothetical protein